MMVCNGIMTVNVIGVTDLENEISELEKENEKLEEKVEELEIKIEEIEKQQSLHFKEFLYGK